VALDGGTGGCGRHHDRDGTFRVSAAVFVRPPPSLTWCLCVVWLGVVPQTSCPICCFCRVYIYIYVRADCAQARGGFTRQSGGVAVVVWRACGGMRGRFVRLEGAERRRRVRSARQLWLDRLFFTTTMI
jgi:hypothetical protein